ncbi:hypothetical protein [Streptomyces vinaceus]|uniref:hypothetical protein n=1 Tax=Streptomyces vinaceus TaxID=1960 RepID=UPI00167663AC|nr:hypothetical protein [Streptomyces vinaceus]GHE77174.1 hypothetical protein GCM10017778_73600 [Streptomyces vinaceus]
MTRQNSIYEATVPVPLYIAAILAHPAVTAGADYGQDATTPRPDQLSYGCLSGSATPPTKPTTHTALVAAIPLIEHPRLTEHQAALAGHA